MVSEADFFDFWILIVKFLCYILKYYENHYPLDTLSHHYFFRNFFLENADQFLFSFNTKI